MPRIPLYETDLAAFVSTDKNRPNIEAIKNVRISPHISEATDSFRLVRVVKMQDANDPTPPADFLSTKGDLYPAHVLETAAKVARATDKKAQDADVFPGSGSDPTDYPDTDRVVERADKELDGKNGRTVALSVAYLLDLLKYAKKHNGNTLEAITLSVSGPSDPVRFTFPIKTVAGCRTVRVDSYIMPIRI